ncbi:MAG: hypothetical protein Q7J22_00400 [Candidatus Wolfebacteria bacterium]|nr:hypothetical protein [Candidatus Wolfebacteria bacterium]
MKIQNIALREIFDSRGDTTLEFELEGGGGTVRASIPAGRSKGKNEVVAVDFAKAKNVLGTLKKKLIGVSFNSIQSFDKVLLAYDSERRKEKIGGNVALGLSIAFTKLLAGEKEPWEVVQKEFFRGQATKKPAIFANFIEGGAHAKNNLAIQEYLVVARPKGNMQSTIQKLVALYRKLLVRPLPIGDEGGIDEQFKNNFEPIQILDKLIRSEGLEGEFGIGLDAAANHFQKGGEYTLDNKTYGREKLKKIYKTYKDKISLLYSIEDPFAENDEEGFKELQAECENLLIIGDDLTTTNPETIERSAKEKLITGVIIKPNQIGTVTETCKAIQVAKKHGLKTIISHRAGETEDVFIIELARASGADGVKIGAPARERIYKYNELLRLYG